MKESTEVIKIEKEYVDSQIATLLPTNCVVANKNVVIAHNLVMTMIDGKVANAISGTRSTQSCNVCGSTSKTMNKLEKLQSMTLNESTFQYELSPLHAWIRFLEYFLHLSYRLDNKTWQARNVAEKESVAQRKQEIQNKFRAELGLIVDQPKPGGSGNTNDGNTARKFFQNAEISAHITRIKEEAIIKCRTILQAINCGHAINTSFS